MDGAVSLTWETLVEIEPNLARLFSQIQQNDSTRDFWPGWSKHKRVLCSLVGWNAQRQELRSDAAYDVAYRHCFDELTALGALGMTSPKKPKGGWVKLWRRTIQSEVFQDDGVFKLWVWLLMKANTKPRKAILKIGRTVNVVELLPGQYIIRSRLAAQDLRIGRNTLDRRLKVLSQLGNIVLSSDPQRRFTLITIANWERYQSGRFAGSTVEPPSEPHHKKSKKSKKSISSELRSKPLVELSEFTFPTKGKGGHSWTLPALKLEEYLAAYPDLDVTSEMRKARQWCRDNPSKQKTVSGMLSFLTRWLNHNQNSGANHNGHNGNGHHNGNGKSPAQVNQLTPPRASA